MLSNPNHVMVGRSHVDVPDFDFIAVARECCGKHPGSAQQIRQDARVRATMHHDKDCRRAGSRQRRNDAPKGTESTGRSCNYDNAVHSASVSILGFQRLSDILCLAGRNYNSPLPSRRCGYGRRRQHDCHGALGIEVGQAGWRSAESS
jgi:hypothetical protein